MNIYSIIHCLVDGELNSKRVRKTSQETAKTWKNFLMVMIIQMDNNYVIKVLLFI